MLKKHIYLTRVTHITTADRRTLTLGWILLSIRAVTDKVGAFICAAGTKRVHVIPKSFEIVTGRDTVFAQTCTMFIHSFGFWRFLLHKPYFAGETLRLFLQCLEYFLFMIPININ